MATFFLSCFTMDKWAIKKLDKCRRNFLWAGDEEARGSKCLVNFKQCCTPKSLGGLGIKELTCYSRALRLRWCWFEWDNIDRPWKGTQIPCDTVDRSLFAACTKISLGNGKKINFWKDRWMHGIAPIALAPEVAKLAWKKNLKVADALTNNLWMKGLHRMNNEEQVQQFVSLWEKIQEVQLSHDDDGITWILNSKGIYTAKDAYEAQFLGRIRQPLLEKAWKVKAENKIKFYLWLLLQNRNWTADRLSTRGWPCNPTCPFCDQAPETAIHILLGCPYSKEVWNMSGPIHPQMTDVALSSNSVKCWWRKLHLIAPKEIGKEQIAFAAYVAWHHWNERNRRVFQCKMLLPHQVFMLVTEDFRLCKEAFRE